MNRTLLTLLAALMAVASLAVAGCGGDDGGDDTGGTESGASEPQPYNEGAVEMTGAAPPQNVPAAAHIQPQIGVFAGLEPDAREGTPPSGTETGDLESVAEAASCELALDLPNEGNTHFEDEMDGVYGTNPPTSGDHLGSVEAGSGALADGAYLSTPPESRAVHAMEHGRVEIRYSPDLPEEDQLALKGVFDSDPAGMIMFPDPDLPYDVAVSAWLNYAGCESYSPEAIGVIQAFRDTFRGNGPENFPIEL